MANLPNAAEIERIVTFCGVVFISIRSFLNAQRLKVAATQIVQARDDVRELHVTVDGRMEQLVRELEARAALADQHGKALGELAGRAAERADSASEAAMRAATHAGQLILSGDGNGAHPVLDVRVTAILPDAKAALSDLIPPSAGIVPQ